MGRVRWGVMGGLLALLACGSLLALADTVTTSGGSVLRGTIESGIPAIVSVTSETGDSFTVQKTNLKSIRFPGEGETNATVETFDGNILIGVLGGVPDVIGLETTAGDVQSIQVASIVEIRFEEQAAVPEPAVPASAPAVTSPLVMQDADAAVAGVMELHESSKAGLTLGLDSGLQLGYTSKSGLGIPRWTLGFDFLLLGPVWRTYFGPSATRVEEAARKIASNDPSTDLEGLTEEVRAEVAPFLLPYLHVGTNALLFPELGGGVMLRLGRAFYIDLGASIDTLGLIWYSVGLQIVL